MELKLPWLLTPDLPANTQLNLTQSSITLGHKMSLPGGTSDPRSTRPKGDVVSHLATRCLCLGRIRLTCCLIASQPASCNWPASHQCAQISNCQTSGWSHSWWRENWGPNHIGPWSRVPVLLLVPLVGVAYLTKARQVKKWAQQPFIYLWHYLQGLFAVLYLHHLITYSCTKCREMLSRLFSVQINLCISSTINLVYHYTQVLHSMNYFYNHK